MGNLKKLAKPSDSTVEVVCPLTNEEIEQRQKDYNVLDLVTFAKKYRGSLFKETILKYQRERAKDSVEFLR